ncbi:YbgA family protein [Mesotoga sp.]|uniref:YbgA family protein n=1 Tax=Mesotoga sp. TaxID=2053577 RepID=UPI00345E620B
MLRLAKPEVVVSRCLGFESCRYNAQMIPNKFVKKLEKFVNYRTVCPEYDIGLGVPRPPIRMVFRSNETRLVQPLTGVDVTERLLEFTESFFAGLERVDGFILKSASPVCGIKDVKVYPGEGKVASSGRDSGFFGGTVLERYCGLPIEDEGRLSNFTIREHFLTILFTVTRFRDLSINLTRKGLVDFQSDNKLLFMSYNQNEMRIMGRIIGKMDSRGIEEVYSDYSSHFYKMMSTPPKHTSHINVLMHGLGYFSNYISSSEKRFFLETLERYRDGKIPLSVPLYILRSYIVAFDSEYLARQTFFQPYPAELIEITDSGKGRSGK